MLAPDALSSPSGDHPEALTTALGALLDHHGGSADLDGLSVALALPFIICADPREPDVARFATFARDIALLEAARLFGVRVRPLHSRATAATLYPSPEFALHFHDSYAPLIRRALAHDQPVLAWQGWPTPAEYAWGLITRSDGATGTLSGWVAGCAGAVPLASPALQCYVVEEVHHRTPAPADVLACAAVGAARHLDECVTHHHAEGAAPTCSPNRQAAGPTAWRLWADRLRAAHASTIAAHLAFAQSLAANRTTAARWLERHSPSLPTPATAQLHDALTTTATHLQELITHLANSSVPAACAALTSAAESDARAHAILQRLHA